VWCPHQHLSKLQTAKVYPTLNPLWSPNTTRHLYYDEQHLKRKIQQSHANKISIQVEFLLFIKNISKAVVSTPRSVAAMKLSTSRLLCLLCGSCNDAESIHTKSIHTRLLWCIFFHVCNHSYLIANTLTGNETLNSLSVEAAKGALQMAEVEAENVDVVILCSSTPDDLFGGAARVSIGRHFVKMMILNLNLLKLEDMTSSIWLHSLRFCPWGWYGNEKRRYCASCLDEIHLINDTNF